MLSLDSLAPEILERIIDILPHDGQLALSTVSRRFRRFIPLCDLPVLKLQLIKDQLSISALSIDQQLAQQFAACHEHSTTRTKRIGSGKMDCVRSLSFPPTDNFSLFAKARIGHLEMNKTFPISLDDDNLKHLSALFSGCTVDKITLVLDNKTIYNLDNIAQFLSSIHAKQVEFVRQTEKNSEKNLLAFDALFNLLNARVDCIIVNQHIINSWDRSAFDAFIQKFATLGTPKSLKLSVGNARMLGLSRGNNKRSGGIVIDVIEQSEASRIPDLRITIKFNPEKTA